MKFRIPDFSGQQVFNFFMEKSFFRISLAEGKGRSVMSTPRKMKEQRLEAHVSEIYSDLYKLFRLGAYEQEILAFQHKWPELGNANDFYDYRPPEKDIKVDSRTIKYSDAVENLYQLILFLEKNMEGWVKEHAVQILKIKNLIYEVKDYSLDVPPELGSFFVDQAREFNGPEQVPDDERAKDIKAQIIAALWGVNQLYRLHAHGSYEEALKIIENIETYIRKEMRGQYQHPRESYGLLGLTLDLKGRLLSTKADYANAEKAYAQSSDAYIWRLEQKKEFYLKGYISKEEYEEKKMVTLRRAALVSALGIGYLSFISSRITKALAALRMSRAELMSQAELKQNAGAVYGAFADLLFFACRRAECKRTEEQTIEDVIQRIEACRDTLSKLVPETHYVHRAGIELALALHYRARALPKTGEGIERASKDYAKSLELLESAIKHSEVVEDGQRKNQPLLTEALFIRSYIWRRLPEPTSEKKYLNLLKAEKDANRSLEVATDPRLECEAHIALGSVQYDQSKYYKENPNKGDFEKSLRAALSSFSEALTLNHGKNVRIDAVCYLKLTKLSLLDPNSVALAHDYFKKWKEIENRVEHAFCHDMADDIDKQLSEGGPLLVVNAEFSLSYPKWEEKLRKHLITVMLSKLSEKTKKKQYNDGKLKSLIVATLIKRLEFKKFKAYEIFKKEDLLERLKALNKSIHPNTL